MAFKSVPKTASTSKLGLDTPGGKKKPTGTSKMHPVGLQKLDPAVGVRHSLLLVSGVSRHTFWWYGNAAVSQHPLCFPGPDRLVIPNSRSSPSLICLPLFSFFPWSSFLSCFARSFIIDFVIILSSLLVFFLIYVLFFSFVLPVALLSAPFQCPYIHLTCFAPHIYSSDTYLHHLNLPPCVVGQIHNALI